MFRLFHPRLFGWCLKLAIVLMIVYFFQTIGAAIFAEGEAVLVEIGHAIDAVKEQAAPILNLAQALTGSAPG